MTESTNVDVQADPTPMPDENMHLFVYGNVTIRDVESGDVLVNKSF